MTYLCVILGAILLALFDLASLNADWPDFFAGAFFATLIAGFWIRRICLKQLREYQRIADFHFALAQLTERENRVLRKQLEALERSRE